MQTHMYWDIYICGGVIDELPSSYLGMPTASTIFGH